MRAAFTLREPKSHEQQPLLEATLAANENQMKKALRMIDESGKRRVGLIGLSFKPKTDDLRNSPYVVLSETLIGRGFDLAIYDPTVSLA